MCTFLYIEAESSSSWCAQHDTSMLRIENLSMALGDGSFARSFDPPLGCHMFEEPGVGTQQPHKLQQVLNLDQSILESIPKQSIS